MNYFINLNEFEIDFLNFLNPLLKDLKSLNILKERIEELKNIKLNTYFNKEEIKIKEEEQLTLIASDLILNTQFSDILLSKEDVEKEFSWDFWLKSDLNKAYSKLNGNSLNKILEIISMEKVEMINKADTNNKMLEVKKSISKINSNNFIILTLWFFVIFFSFLTIYLQFIENWIKLDNIEYKQDKDKIEFINIKTQIRETNSEIDKIESKNIELKDKLDKVIDFRKKERLNDIKFKVEQGILEAKDLEILKKEIDSKDF